MLDRETFEASIQRSTNHSWEEYQSKRNISFGRDTRRNLSTRQSLSMRLEQLERRVSSNEIRYRSRMEPLEQTLK
jgi:hypothetical protein